MLEEYLFFIYLVIYFSLDGFGRGRWGRGWGDRDCIGGKIFPGGDAK